MHMHIDIYSVLYRSAYYNFCRLFIDIMAVEISLAPLSPIPLFPKLQQKSEIN